MLHECGVDFVRDVLDAAVCHACFKIAGLDVGKDIQLLNFSQNLSSGFGSDLASVCAIDLVAIVLAGIVRCGHHDTGRGVQITGCKRHGRNRH